MAQCKHRENFLESERFKRQLRTTVNPDRHRKDRIRVLDPSFISSRLSFRFIVQFIHVCIASFYEESLSQLQATSQLVQDRTCTRLSPAVATFFASSPVFRLSLFCRFPSDSKRKRVSLFLFWKKIRPSSVHWEPPRLNETSWFVKYRQACYYSLIESCAISQ